MTAKIVSPNPEMGARGKARREQLGLEKNRLAVRLGIGTSRLSQMELDGVEGLTAIKRWAEALEMDPQELAFGKPAKQRKGK